VARRYVRPNREHNQEKFGDSIVVPLLDAGEVGGARASAFGSSLSCALIKFVEPAWHSGVSKLRSLTSDVSRTRSAWVDNLTGAEAGAAGEAQLRQATVETAEVR
jgi:hypothetical protein